MLPSGGYRWSPYRKKFSFEQISPGSGKFNFRRVDASNTPSESLLGLRMLRRTVPGKCMPYLRDSISFGTFIGRTVVNANCTQRHAEFERERPSHVCGRFTDLGLISIVQSNSSFLFGIRNAHREDRLVRQIAFHRSWKRRQA